MLCRKSYVKLNTCLKDIVLISIALVKAVRPLWISHSPFSFAKCFSFQSWGITSITPVLFSRQSYGIGKTNIVYISQIGKLKCCYYQLVEEEGQKHFVTLSD